MTDKEKAEDYIRRMRKQMDDTDNPIYMVVPFRKGPHDYTKGETDLSTPVPAHCTKCGQPVWSSAFKQWIKKLAQEVHLLCPVCMAIAYMNHKNEGGGAIMFTPSSEEPI
jgi:hypothetical protein